MRRDGDRFHGPGIADMKAGGYLAFKAAEHIAGLVHQPSMPLTLLYTSDEEIGSPTSRGIIERLASESRYALIAGAGPQGRGHHLPQRTREISPATSRVGKRTPAPPMQAGRSAISEIARQIIKLDQLTDYSTGTTVNVGEIGGGTTPNVVAGHAFCTIDVRFSTAEAGRMVDETIFSVGPIGSDVTVTPSGEIEKPCLERTAGGLKLFGLAKSIAHEQDIDLIETSSERRQRREFYVGSRHPDVGRSGRDRQRVALPERVRRGFRASTTRRAVTANDHRSWVIDRIRIGTSTGRLVGFQQTSGLSLGGTNLYMTLATLFIAHAMNVQLSCDDPATWLGPKRSPPRYSSSAPGVFLSMKCPNAEAIGLVWSSCHACASKATTRRPCFTIETLA